MDHFANPEAHLEPNLRWIWVLIQFVVQTQNYWYLVWKQGKYFMFSLNSYFYHIIDNKTKNKALGKFAILCHLKKIWTWSTDLKQTIAGYMAVAAASLGKNKWVETFVIFVPFATTNCNIWSWWVDNLIPDAGARAHLELVNHQVSQTEVADYWFKTSSTD